MNRSLSIQRFSTDNPFSTAFWTVCSGRNPVLDVEFGFVINILFLSDQARLILVELWPSEKS